MPLAYSSHRIEKLPTIADCITLIAWIVGSTFATAWRGREVRLHHSKRASCLTAAIQPFQAIFLHWGIPPYSPVRKNALQGLYSRLGRSSPAARCP